MRSATSSRFLIAALNQPDATKVNASTKTAYGAVSTWISPPPIAGPAPCAAETVTCSFELPSTSWLALTSEGRYDW